MRVFITGGTGFVGRHVVARLLRNGHFVRALVRDPASPRSQELSRTGVELIRGDVTDGTGLASVDGCDAVIHLVGIIVEQGTNTFELAHYVGARNVAEAAWHAGAQRMVHMSALGTRANAPTEYHRTKWLGEEAVRSSGAPYTILRPSLIFGAEGEFVRQMLHVMRSAPLVRPVPGTGKYLFRPILVEDVAECFVQSLTNPAALNQTIELGGHDEMALDELLAMLARCAGVRKRPIHIPIGLMKAGAMLAERIFSAPPVTVDQLRMMEEGSTCSIAEMKRVFGFDPGYVEPALCAAIAAPKPSSEERV